MSSLKYFFRKYPKEFCFYSLLYTIENFLEFLGVSLFAPLVQFVSGEGAPSGRIGSFFKMLFDFFGLELTLNKLLVLICLIFLLKALFIILLRYMSSGLSARFVMEASVDFIAKLKDVEKSYYETLNRAEVTNVVGEHLKKSSTIIIWYLMSISSIIALLGYLALVLIVSLELTGVALVASLAFLLLVKAFLSRSSSIGLDHVTYSKSFNRKLLEVLEHLTYAKSSSLEEGLVEGLIKPINDVAKNWKYYQFSSSSLTVAFQPLVAIVLSIIIYFGVSLHIPFGEIIVFLVAIQRMLPVYTALQNLKNNIVLTEPSLTSMQELIDNLERHQEVETGAEEVEFSDNVTFENVTFSYGSRSVLSKCSFRIKKGDLYGLVGPSGSGKSTIISMLLGFYRPDSGSITVDGKNILKINKRLWRKRFSIVSQNEYLLNSSIAENIVYFKKTNHKKLLSCLESSLAKGFVEELENGLEYEIADQSQNLSGGQRQRISLARMLYSDGDIFVLDEPTSALDKKTAAMFVKILRTFKNKGKTVILITHDEDLLKYVDTILRVENGIVSLSKRNV